MRRAGMLVCIAAAGWPLAVPGQDEPEASEPDLELLEYLGSWQEQDEEWWVPAALDGALERDDDVPEPAPRPGADEGAERADEAAQAE